MKKNTLLLIGFFFVLGVITSRAENKTNGLTVEVLIYSGRPNPTFVVTDPKVIKELTSSAKALAKQAARTKGAVPSKLGFRGFAVRNSSGTETDLQGFVVNGAEVDLVAGGDSSDFRQDPSGQLEKRLIELTEQHGAVGPELVKHMKQKK